MQLPRAPVDGQDDQSNASRISSTVILATKLYRPPVSADLESRAALVTRLETNRQRALTLISAPAGYGKSTLASMWIEVSEMSACWISLDDEDNDPRTFLAYVVAAVQSVSPNTRLRAETLLAVSSFPSPATVARTLLNDLEQVPQRFLLVLDDLHVIRSPAVYDILAELLHHPSPTLHLVLSTRRDPPLQLPLLRAHRQITEIRTRDLRFSNADTVSYLRKILRRDISEATAASWTQRTEGWVAALGLAAISLRQREQSEVDAELSREDIPLDSRYLQEYLLAEVVNRLDPTVKEWLLTIACLDRFCPELCEAICQADSLPRADQRQAKGQNGLKQSTGDGGIVSSPELTNGTALTGEAFIQWLQDDNLFVIPLDSENRWFRLHHLFQSLLQNWGRQHYGDDEIAALQRRAGAWFAQHELPDEALRYLIAGRDYAEAERLVQQHRHTLMNTSDWSRLERWLSAFPDGFLERSALLMSTATALAVYIGKGADVASLIQATEQLLAGQGAKSSIDKALQGEVAVFKGLQLIVAGDGPTVVTFAQHALQLLPRDALHLRAIAYAVDAAGKQMSGQFVDGRHLLEETMNETEWTQPIRTKLMDFLCMISFMQGDLATTQVWAERIEQIAGEHGLPESLNMARHFLGVIHYLRHEYDAAEPYLRALLEDHAVSAPSYLTMGTFALALIYNSRGDLIQADAIIDRINTHFRSTRHVFALNIFQAFSVDLAWRRGDFDAAQRKRIGVNFAHRPPLWFFYIPRLTPIKLLLTEGTPDALTAARATLEELAQQMAAIHRNVARIDILALLALVCDAQGDDIAAEASVTTALALALMSGVIQPFVDLGTPMAKLLQRLGECDEKMSEATRAFVTQVLTASATPRTVHGGQRSSARFGAQRAPSWPLPFEPLTPRESEILQQLAGDATPAEIAVQSVVSLSTVRSQIKSIYRKLDVHNRIEAVNRGREFGIL